MERKCVPLFVLSVLFVPLFPFPVGSQISEAPHALHVEVVEGTLHVEYMLTTAEEKCTQNDTLYVEAHISWRTEKENTAALSLSMGGTPYAEQELSELLRMPVALKQHENSSIFESKDISGFWNYWFDHVSEYGVFSDYSRNVIFNWNEAEIVLHEDEKGRTYSLKATYYDFFTKFYPTPEAFFDERELDFQLIFGIHHLLPKTELSIVIDLPEEATIVLVDPPAFSVGDSLILTAEPNVEISNIRVKFRMGRYKGTELPQLQVVKEISAHSIKIDEQVTIKVIVQNTSSEEAVNVRIQDSISEAFDIIQGEPSLKVETLEGGKEVMLTYTVKFCNAGDFILEGACVEFEDQFGKTYSVCSDEISVTVNEELAVQLLLVVAAMVIFLELKKKASP